MSAGTVMIMAGGTGGHVFPGLAVADALKSRDCRVIWLGTERGLESRLVPAHGIEIHYLPIRGVRGKRLASWLAAPFRIGGAIVRALSVLRTHRPAVVLGMGGFVAGPGGMAAWLTRRPLLIHEQNAIAGTTNRLLARFASRAFEAFPASFPGRDAETVGNPIRADVAAVGQRRQPRDTAAQRHLLVFGGSQGALALNELLPAALALLPAGHRPCVRHQAGRFAAETAASYARSGVEADVVEFIDDMAAAYEWADLAVARAGALTVSELAAAGLGAILIPLPGAIDDHQALNAQWLASAGAAKVLRQADTTPATLAAELTRCLDAATLADMGAAARGAARTDAGERIADACCQAAEGRR